MGIKYVYKNYNYDIYKKIKLYIIKIRQSLPLNQFNVSFFNPLCGDSFDLSHIFYSNKSYDSLNR